jgi:hypothetical protein
MNDIAASPAGAGPGPRLASFFVGTFRAMVSTYRLGGLAWLAAPAILAIAVLPELAQHMAEIHLGMFDSKEAARAVANDPLRWAFGYLKIAGLVVAILATARFWALGSVRRALLIAPGNLFRLVLAIALTLAAELPFALLKQTSNSEVLDGILTAASMLVQAGLLVYLVGALLDDPSNGLRRAFTDRWPTALLITLLAALAFLPAQTLHHANHMAALGQHPLLVWALMIFDSLLVGLMAVLVGSALFVGYRAGPTWRGWSERSGMR